MLGWHGQRQRREGAPPEQIERPPRGGVGHTGEVSLGCAMVGAMLCGVVAMLGASVPAMLTSAALVVVLASAALAAMRTSATLAVVLASAALAAMLTSAALVVVLASTALVVVLASATLAVVLASAALAAMLTSAALVVVLASTALVVVLASAALAVVLASAALAGWPAGSCSGRCPSRCSLAAWASGSRRCDGQMPGVWEPLVTDGRWPAHSTVTDLARFRGWSTSQPRWTATW